MMIIQLDDGKVILPAVDFSAKSAIVDFMGRNNILEVPLDISAEENPWNYKGSWRCSFAEIYTP